VGIVLVGLALVALRAVRREWPLPRATQVAVALGLGLAFVSSPYLLVLRAQSGEWRVSQKKSLGHLAGLEEYRGPLVPGVARPGDPSAAPGSVAPRPRAVPPWVEPSLGERPGARARPSAQGLARVGSELGEFLENVSSALRRAALLFLLVGCWVARGRPGPRGTFVLAVVAGYALLLLAHQWNVGYLSRRHLLPPLVVAFGYAGLGVEATARLVASALARAGLRVSNAAAGAALVGIVALTNGAKAVRPERSDALAERRAAEWVRERDAAPGFVAAPRRRVAYYAGARWVALPRALEPATFEEMRRIGVRYVILDDAKRGRYPGLAEAEPSQLRLVHRAEAAGRRASVWEVAPRAGSRAAAPAASEG
jgi:hypothetical protein